MPRTRISTTVDSQRLNQVRRLLGRDLSFSPGPAAGDPIEKVIRDGSVVSQVRAGLGLPGELGVVFVGEPGEHLPLDSSLEGVDEDRQRMVDDLAVRRVHGEVWWADLDRVRPVVILTRRR